MFKILPQAPTYFSRLRRKRGILLLRVAQKPVVIEIEIYAIYYPHLVV